MHTDKNWIASTVSDHKPLVVILGPTAVGKSQIAIQVAQNLSAEIISADSRLLYIGMDIGTAKPTLAERALVPHHLIDVTTPDRIWSLAKFQSSANRVIESIHQRHRIPILVGGTGQYIHALTQGWKIPQAAPNPKLRLILEDWAAQIGNYALHHRLAHLDPASAAGIDPSNIRRTIRALEVIFTTGRLFSTQKRRLVPPYNILQLGIIRPRQELYQRVDERIDQMLQAGFITEVQHLLDQGYSTDCPTLSAIGYREIATYLRGQCSLDEAVALMKRRTRVFIRRQANWFKPNDQAIHWFMGNYDTPSRVEQFISHWLSALTNFTGSQP